MSELPLFPRFPDSADQPRDTGVPGLRIVPGWISGDEERALMAHIDAEPWQQDFKRRVHVYGIGYGGDGEPAWVADFPDWLVPLAQRITDEHVLPRFPENCVVNDYAPGVGIAPHRDYAPFGLTIASISLLSDVVMDFIEASSNEKVSHVLRARCLTVLHGAARWRWKHGIAVRKSDVIDGVRVPRKRRVSVTFRIAKDPEMAARLREDYARAKRVP